MAEDFISLQYKGIDRVQRRMKRVEAVVRDPHPAPIVNNIAKVWKVNYNTEGSMVGGWRDLTQMTQQVRESRGFQPDHPILKQYGHLYQAAIESLVNARGRSGRSNQDGASMTWTSSNGRILLRIAGKKVSNQFRQQSRKRGSAIYSAPPRRFWFVNPAVVNAAKAGLLKSINKELREAR